MNTTELKKTQEQVRIREEEYKVLVKRSGKIVYRYNIRDKKIEFPMGTEFLSNLVDYNGSYAENVIQAGFVANESETEFRQFCDGISHGKTEGSAKIKSRRKNDGYKWYQCQYTTIYDNDGAPVSAIITLEDITSQQQAEAELKILRKEQELLSVITAHTDRKLFRYDIGLRKAVMGNTVAEEWGIPCDVDETLCEFLPYDILSPESIRDYERMMRDIHYGAKGRVVIRIKTSNLGWRLYQMDYTTVKGQDGAPEYAIISYQNVQEQYIDRVTHAMIWEIFKLIPSGRYLVIHGLLSDNVVETLRGDLFNIKARHMHCVSLDEIAQWISRTRIHEEDRERWDRYHNRNWLLYVFDKDVHCLNQWYRLCPDCLEDGTGLIQELIILVKSPYTENVYASSVLWIKDTMIEQKTFSLNDTIWESERLSGTRSERARKAEDTPHRIHIRTFGYFDVFVDGQILDFTSRKGKELLAILVDRNGGVCTSEDIISMLWENEPMSRTISSRYRQTVKRLKRFLDEAGIGDILVSKKGGKCVDTTRFTCDFYEYLKGNTHYRKMFHHLYMTNYSWGGEYTCSTICHERRLEK
ncbi:MAG: hypothetical protein LUE94_06915 [Clostridiales bacterium]|nr:hypothetical protein [Clostridiales bacterium]